MPMQWPNLPATRSGAEVPDGTFVAPPGLHRTCAGNYAGITGG